jgi:hypothetical protein
MGRQSLVKLYCISHFMKICSTDLQFLPTDSQTSDTTNVTGAFNSNFSLLMCRKPEEEFIQRDDATSLVFASDSLVSE